MNSSSHHLRIYLPFCLAATVIIAVSVLQYPGAPDDVTLDQSWNAALSYFAFKHFQFGPQVAYTFGPIAYLTDSSYSGGSLGALMAGRIAFAWAAAGVLGYIGWFSRSYLLLALLTGQSVLFGVYQHDSAFLAIGAALACFCVAMPASRWMLCATAVVLVFSALDKFTYLTQSSALIALVSVFLIATRQTGKLALFLSVSAVSLVTLWMGPGHQNPSGLPLFVKRSFAVASGYNDAMALPGPIIMLEYGLGIAALLLAMVVLQAISAPSLLAGCVRGLILTISIFIAWKEAFTRSDYGHELVFVLAAQIFSILVIALALGTRRMKLSEDKSPRKRSIAPLALVSLGMLATTIVSYIALIEVSDHGRPTMFSITEAADRMVNNVRFLYEYPDYAAFVQGRLAVAKEHVKLSKLDKDIGTGSVDVFGDEVAIVFLNGWNYRPRPMFQSFFVYNKYLMDINRDFVLSESAPDFYLMKLTPIDDRSATEADAEAFEAILDRYEPIDAERGYLLLKKRNGSEATVESSGTASFHEPITLSPSEPRTMDWLIADIQPSLIGRIRSLLFEAAPLHLVIATKTSGTVDFRLIPNLARVGIPLNPMLYGLADLHSFLSDGKTDSALRATVEVAPEDEVYFRPRFSYSVVRRRIYPGNMPKPQYLSALMALDAAPSEISTASYPRVMSFEGHDVLFVHAPSSVTIPVPGDATRVRGSFGVLNGAFSHAPTTTHVDFGITIVTASGQHQIFNHSMKASGSIPFDVTLPPGDNKNIILTANISPDFDAGWTFWQGVGFGQ